MGKETEIAWTDHTFNPWWGCQRVSPGCEHCYAETFANRLGLKVWGPESDRRLFGDKHWMDPIKWNHAAEKAGVRRRVFCASMSDWAEDRLDLVAPRVRLARTIALTPFLDWQMLTKRIENAEQLWDAATSIAVGMALASGDKSVVDAYAEHGTWLPNVWLGTTTENQEWFDRRHPHLVSIPARVKFISYEPAIGPLNLPPVHGLDWVIIGGESGSGARPFDLSWARNVIEQCSSTMTAAFMKQLGGYPIDGLAGCEVWQRHPKGGDPAEWPEEIRVRQFPGGAT